MSTIVRISTDWQARIHVQADADVSTHDAALVELPPYSLGVPLLVYRDGASMDELWNEALRTLEALRSQPHKAILPARVFVPFGVITLRRLEDVWREHELRREMMMVEQFNTDPAYRARVEADPILHGNGRAHEQRVASLCRALDLLNGAPLPVPVPWPDVPARH
ncbi:MAG: hypothetical protein V9E93_16520 [Steroidobacteraceae bacterium]